MHKLPYVKLRACIYLHFIQGLGVDIDGPLHKVSSLSTLICILTQVWGAI